MRRMALLEIGTQARRDSRRNGSALRDWLRALEATAPIAGNPQRTLPNVIEEVAARQRRSPGPDLRRRTLTYRALDRARQSLRPLGAGAKPRQGRTVVA